MAKRMVIMIIPLEVGEIENIPFAQLQISTQASRADYVVMQNEDGSWRKVKDRHRPIFTAMQGAEIPPLDFLDVVYRIAEVVGVELSRPIGSVTEEHAKPNQIQ